MKYTTLSKPMLYDSQLKYRIGLAKARLEYYPLDSMNFVMMDLERPELRIRHADWCSYDLTGRILFFYTRAEGIDGKHIGRLPELYERIMNNRRKSGVFGRIFEHGTPESAKAIGNPFICGLIEYYVLTGDMRALNAARECGEHMLSWGDEFYRSLIIPEGPNLINCWVTESFAELYKHTGDERYLNAVRRIARECVGRLDGSHSHGYMSTLRGIYKAAMYANDSDLAEFVRTRRQEILDKGCILPNGDVSEVFPMNSPRNEGCSIADWIMLNLLYAHYEGDDKAYAMVEHTLWNALYFNQFITGGFGHRYLSERGYSTYIEEAWWCCTENAGMAMSEVARHVVTMREDQLKLNFLIPGLYTIPTVHGEIKVSVTTQYPSKAETIIQVIGTKADLHIRIPECIRKATTRRVETDMGYTLYLDGKMGHYTERRGRGTVVKYGPMVIAPMIYHWDMAMPGDDENTVPDGYMHDGLFSRDCRLDLGAPDADGFYHFEHDPIPMWISFEEGEMAGIGGGEVASAYVPVVFPGGHKEKLYFQPLCSATTNLTLLDMITDFDVANGTT